MIRTDFFFFFYFGGVGEGGQRGTDNNMLKATLERVEVHQKVQIQQD